MWWNSRNVRSVHLRPSLETKAHWPPSRRQTARWTALGMWRERRPASRTSLSAPRLPHPELGPLDLLEQQSQAAVDDRAWIAVGDLAPEKRLEAPQLVMGLLADSELDPVALRRGGLDDRTRCRNEDTGWRSDRGSRFRGGGRHRRGKRCWRGGRRRVRRELPHGGRDIGSGRQLGNQDLDLGAAPAASPGEDGLVVLRLLCPRPLCGRASDLWRRPLT